MPWDRTLGLPESHLTPGAEQLVALAGMLDSFAEASQKILPRLCGLQVSESTVERTTEAAGARVGRLLFEQKQTFGPDQTWDWYQDAEGQTCAYLSGDATGVRQQGPGGAAAEGRMPYVAMVYNPTPADWQGKRPPWQARYLSSLCELKDLGGALRRQAAQVGTDQAQRWIALSDGGAGLEDFFRVNFPRAEVILDFYHAAEHLGEFARLLCGPDEDRVPEQTQAWCHTLKHEGGRVLLEELERLDLPRSEAIREGHRLLTGYVRKNLHRMDYPSYQALGWHIGSGPIESACKTVVGQRLKGPGMRWGEDGTDALCHLRALYKGEATQWAHFWNRSLN